MMVDKREFAVFVNAMRTFYPKEKLLPNNAAMELWYDQLQDIDYQAASTALKRWVQTEKWSPSIADIRSSVASLNNPDQIEDVASAWGTVMRMISKHGAWNQDAALSEMTPLTRACVQAIGWENICGSENISAERAHFQRMFAERKEIANKSQQIAPALRTPTEERLVLDFGNIVKRLN